LAKASDHVVVHICCNCAPDTGELPRQWEQDGVRVLVREIPCSGKTDAQYLFRALEGGARGICVVACPKGECRLAQGNYRAEVRIQTIRRLLEEIGIQPERAELLHSSPNDPPGHLAEITRESVERLCRLGQNPIYRGHVRGRVTKETA